MKQQIKRLSPHQNAKVFASLMAVVSFLLALPLTLIANVVGPKDTAPPLYFILVLPIAYLVIGYVMTVVGCAIYNFIARYVGGFEFEAEAKPE
ncbi:hypothetical protein QTI66_13000 [Variovorax sp. J22R133]|uniref:hypothetical protein n=1 Tax=Variovorax brevis TaxID=3053503 RepID=UPI002576956A|nr:hypothetical protein [Variovorax sp. J22R133]MDM0113069.1 hypothetical protein [Variovorax sp. J22R133]